MANGKFVAYFRVSTQRQGQSGLGLEAQRETVKNYLNGGVWEILGEFTEVESGRRNDRPKLSEALALCKKTWATLICAKLDRLSRDLSFIVNLMSAKVRFVACDLPEANELTLHIFAAFAQHEAKRISERVSDALRAAKARGVVLGKAGTANLKSNIEARRKAADDFAYRLAPVINGFRAQGLSQRKMVEQLNQLNIPATRGGQWSLLQLQNVLKRIDAVKLRDIAATEVSTVAQA